jgi:hypothetical protein
MSTLTCVPNCERSTDRRVSKNGEVGYMLFLFECVREKDRVPKGGVPDRKRKHYSKEVGKRKVKKPPP